MNNNKSFSKTYVGHFTAIMSLIYSYVQNIHEAEDICQNVFTKFYNNIGKIEEKSIYKWLKVTARNEVNNFYRITKNKDEVDITIEHHPNLQYTSNKDVQILLQDVIEGDTVFNDDEERIIFDLVTSYNYTYKEVAVKCKMSRRQVEYRYTMIMKRFLNSLKEKGVSSLEDLYHDE